MRIVRLVFTKVYSERTNPECFMLMRQSETISRNDGGAPVGVVKKTFPDLCIAMGRKSAV